MKLIFWTLFGLWVVPAATKYVDVYVDRRKHNANHP